MHTFRDGNVSALEGNLSDFNLTFFIFTSFHNRGLLLQERLCSLSKFFPTVVDPLLDGLFPSQKEITSQTD